jgi:hypothetical protein
MSSSGMKRRVALVRTNASEERIASIFSIKIISELGTTLAITGVLQLLVTVNVVLSSLIIYTLKMEVIRSPETVLKRATRRHIPDDDIL